MNEEKTYTKRELKLMQLKIIINMFPAIVPEGTVATVQLGAGVIAVIRDMALAERFKMQRQDHFRQVSKVRRALLRLAHGPKADTAGYAAALKLCRENSVMAYDMTNILMPRQRKEVEELLREDR